MRKLISLLIMASMLLGSLCFTSSAGYTPYNPGDVNDSGAINSFDLIELKKHIAGVESKINSLSAELTGDKKVNAKDLLFLKKHIVGIESIEEQFGIGDGTVGLITVGDKNISEYTIVVTNPDNANMVFAAEELKKYVEMASGVTLAIENNESDAEYKITLLEDETDTLGNDGFSITVVDGQLRIMGGALRGTMYGVYELIEEYIGYRFYGYYDSEIFEATAVAITEGLTDVQIPDSLYRNNSITPFHNEYTYNSVVKRKLSGSTTAHSLNEAKYGYGISRLHSNAHSFDFFAGDDCFVVGDNSGNKVFKHCLTDYKIYTDADDGEEDGVISKKSTYQAVLENMCMRIDARIAAGGVIGKDITEISCAYAAFNEFCQCKAPRGQSGRCYDITKTEGTYAGTLVDFVNKIEEEITARYPGIRVITNAYGETKVPPKTRSFNENVVLLYCWNGCVNHSIEGHECSENGVATMGTAGSPYSAILGSNVKEKEYYLGWMEHCSQSYIWYYPTNIYYSLSPLSNTFKIYDDMRWFMENKAVGFYVVGTANDAFDGLNAYLISEMMWDKDITEEEYKDLIKEYLAFYYGPGWENIYTYLEMLEEAGNDMGCYMTEFSHPMEMYSAEYFAEHYYEMIDLFDNAHAESENSWQKANIEKAKAHLGFLGLEALYDSKYVNGTESERADYAAEYEGWYNFVNEYDIRVTYQELGIEEPFDVEKSPCQLIYGFRD
ncbi:MAG: DUF4838 domain-containing protein [Clostridia bacterium]|nr:DUF4838 domain-containing protein [Clostridia bacterium]